MVKHPQRVHTDGLAAVVSHIIGCYDEGERLLSRDAIDGVGVMPHRSPARALLVYSHTRLLNAAGPQGITRAVAAAYICARHPHAMQLQDTQPSCSMLHECLGQHMSVATFRALVCTALSPTAKTTTGVCSRFAALSPSSTPLTFETVTDPDMAPSVSIMPKWRQICRADCYNFRCERGRSTSSDVSQHCEKVRMQSSSIPISVTVAIHWMVNC